jgi:hypothetical protein
VDRLDLGWLFARSTPTPATGTNLVPLKRHITPGQVVRLTRRAMSTVPRDENLATLPLRSTAPTAAATEAGKFTESSGCTRSR